MVSMPVPHILIHKQHMGVATFLLIMMVLDLRHVSVQGLSVKCNTCDAGLCPNTDTCIGGTVRDICGCCMVCARGFNETCGGRFGMLGKCGPGLRCVVTVETGQAVTGHEPGVCKVDEQRTMAVNPCLIIVCAIQLSPDCPMDTVPVGGHPPPGECCPLQGPQCVCTECQHPPDCTDPDMAPVRVRNGTHNPGDCCDSYECQPIVAAANTTELQPCSGPECLNSTASDLEPFDFEASDLESCTNCTTNSTSPLNITQTVTTTPDRISSSTPSSDDIGTSAKTMNSTNMPSTFTPKTTTTTKTLPVGPVDCSTVVCPPTNRHQLCPSDSDAYSSLVATDECCFEVVLDGCECRSSDHCPMLECADGLTSQIMLHATRQPGYCCDVMQCINKTSCLAEGIEYSTGMSWLRGECESCSCVDGEQKCTTIHCDVQGDCTGEDPGHCCASCTGCITEDGIRHSDDAKWAPDNCTICECTQGKVYCKATNCEDLGFVDPIVPTCAPLHGCSIDCLGGLAVDENHCHICQCRDDGCTLDCPHGFVLDSTGAALCVCATELDTVILPEIENHVISAPEVDHTTTSLPDDQLHIDDEEFYDSKSDYSDFSDSDIIYDDVLSDVLPDAVTPPPSAAVHYSLPPTVEVIYSPYDAYPEGEQLLDPLDPLDPYEESLSAPTEVVHSFYEDPPIIIDDHFSSANRHPMDADILYGPDVVMGVPMGCTPLIGCNIKCAYGMKIRKPSGCPRCRCRKCPDFSRCRKVCEHGYMSNDMNCKICKCKSARNSQIDLSDRQYTTSFRPSHNAQCMSLDGRVQLDGEYWHDGCRRCYCHDGREMCALITCPQPQCLYPIIRNGDCCPTCSGELLSVSPGSTLCQTPDGQHRAQGETWFLDACTQCICHVGSILCEVESCPPLLCERTIRQAMKCCRICADQGEYLLGGQLNRPQHGCVTQSGTRLDHGDSWKVNACQSCTCTEGQIHCFHQSCPILRCNRTIMKKGHCCPQCSEAEVSGRCISDREVYHIGEQWIVGDCTKCMCREQGEVRCQEISCPRLPGCVKVIEMPGVCCPICYNISDTTIHPLGNSITLRTVTHHMEGDRHRSNNHTVIEVLVSIVSILFLLIVILVVVICYIRRRHRKRDQTKNLHCGGPGGNLRPKSTNLDFQGNPPPFQQSVGMAKFQQWHEKPPDNLDSEKFSNDIKKQSLPGNMGTNSTVVEEYNDLEKADLNKDIYRLSSAHNESFVKSESPTCSVNSAKDGFSSCSSSSINSIISDKKDSFDDSNSIHSTNWSIHTSDDDLSINLQSQNNDSLEIEFRDDIFDESSLGNQKLIVCLPEERQTADNSAVTVDSAIDCVQNNNDIDSCLAAPPGNSEAADNWSNQVKEQQLLEQREQYENGESPTETENRICIV